MSPTTNSESIEISVATLDDIKPTTLRQDGATIPKFNQTRLGTMAAFLKNGTCSKTLLTVMNREFEQVMPVEEAAADPLAGGLMQGYQCGMLWGSTLAAGSWAYRELGSGAAAEAAAVRAGGRLAETFRDLNEHINCLEITDTDPNNGWQVFMHFFVKGGTINCMKRAATFAPKAWNDIHAAVDKKACGGPCRPGNCAAKLAREMGASDRRATMAAGFAGGIGLRGGACGALAAAIWLTGIHGREAGYKNKVINQRISAIIDAFLKVTGYEFECRNIVGKTFENTDEHADHVRKGGCANIIATLVAASFDSRQPSETR
jgi:hypothetical protein